MFHVVLYQPEIPPNTGNIMRLCANTGAELHLIRPLGFSMEERRLRRAGLDYAEFARVKTWPDLPACLAALSPARAFALSSKVSASYADVAYVPGDVFVFGPETRGLPGSVLDSFTPETRRTIPMQAGNRSLNLANSVAVVVYEAWRQQAFRRG